MTNLLLKLELRRQRSQVMRMALATLGICAVFVLAGKRQPSDQLALLLGSGIGVSLMIPMGIVRDKLEGTLDFICGLPVEPRDIAASRFIASAVLVAPWALAVGTLKFTMPASGAMNALDAAVLSWLALSLLGVCLTAVFVLFEFTSLMGTPVLVLVAACVLTPRVVARLFPAVTEKSIVEFLNRPGTPLMLAVALMALIAVVGSVAFAAATRGLATYRHNPAAE